ncbi:MAG: TonB-dependent receptor [Sandaracinaceae bacterium]|nr:TonB-dependent receptor [Sandaracinaceae bacterium]
MRAAIALTAALLALATPAASAQDDAPAEGDPRVEERAPAEDAERDDDAGGGEAGEAGEGDAGDGDAGDGDAGDGDAGDGDAGDGDAGEDDAGEDDDIFPDDGDMGDLIAEDEDVSVDEVVVQGAAEAEPPRAPPTGGVVHRLDAELLDRWNYDNPDAVIQQVPGAYVRQEDGYGLRPNIGLRGVAAERSARVTLMEDGILFGPAPYAAPAAYYFPLMTRMTGVDVYLGAATLPYGPMSVGGALDLRNRPIPRAPAGGLDLSLGSNLYGRVHAWGGAGNEWGGLLAEGVYLRSDGFKHLVGAADRFRDTGFDRAEAIIRGELRGALTRDVYHRLELRLGVSVERSRETYLGLADADFAADPWQRYPSSQLDTMEWWRTQVQLRHVLEAGDGFVLESAAYRHDLDRSWLKLNGLSGATAFDVLTNPRGRNAVLLGVLRGTEDSEGGTAGDLLLIGNNARRFGATGLQTEGTGRFATGELRHRVRVGARLHHDAVDRHHTEDQYAMLAGQLSRVTPEAYTNLRSHAEALALSLHVAYALTLFEAVTLTAGARSELIWTSYHDLETDARASDFRGVVLPGGSVDWQIERHVGVFAGVMRGFAPVSPGQAPTVQPEDSVNYEAGARFTHEETRTSAMLTGFVNDYSNYLQQCSFTAGCDDRDLDMQANGGRPLVAGFDVRVSATPRIDELRIPLRVSYTYTFAELREAIVSSPSPLFHGAQPGDRLPYVPEHQIVAQAGLETDRFGVNASGSFVSQMWEGAGRGEDSPVPRTDALFLLDASAYVQVTPELRIYLRGENLTFTQVVASRRPFGARPNRPFQLQGGVQLQL